LRPSTSEPFPLPPSSAVEQASDVSGYELHAFGLAPVAVAQERRDAKGVDASRLEASIAAMPSVAPNARPPATEPIRIAVPQVAIYGYCLVTLMQSGEWVRGDPRCAVIYRGATYQFCGPAERQQFNADPTAFVPVNSGNDVVLMVDERQTAPGLLGHSAIYNGRWYMFSSAATQARFNTNPPRYAVGK
jgi:YHS domain-containing protein